jgi:hypothetical protein
MNAPIRKKSKQSPGEWGDWVDVSNGYFGRSRTVNGRQEKQLQHRFVMEQYLGRELLAGENVHHLNGVRHDNRIENLELWIVSQPKGQRIVDKVSWAKELLALYEPEALA